MKVVLGPLAVLSVIGLVIVRAEYRFWGGLLSRFLPRAASALSPRSRRPLLRDEWADQLGVLQERQGHAGVLFTLTLFVATGRLRLMDTRRALGSWRLRKAKEPPLVAQKVQHATARIAPVAAQTVLPAPVIVSRAAVQAAAHFHRAGRGRVIVAPPIAAPAVDRPGEGAGQP
jgi:hypothetical protein